MKLRYALPLAGYVVPTLGIGFGFVIPGTCVAGINDLSIGFVGAVIGACITYGTGVAMALRGRSDGT